MSSYLLPILLVVIFIYCFIKNVPAYDHFVKGAKGAVDLVISIFPYLAAIFIFVEVMKASGFSDYLSSFLSPALNFLGIPPELAELVFLRPFSGSGSLALLEELFKSHGADSFVGRCAAVVVGASDTIFYIIALYFSTINIKKMGYLVPVCLVAQTLGSIVACLLVRLFMG